MPEIDPQTVEYIRSIVATLAGFGIVIEVTPWIKINPVSWILGKLGDALNKNQEEKLKNISQSLGDLKKQMTDHEIDQLRWNILDFANSCRQGKRHTKDEFDHVIRAHTDYLAILQRTGRTNGQVDADYRYIEEIYNKCMHDNDFL